jgi:hypothetical protein
MRRVDIGPVAGETKEQKIASLQRSLLAPSNAQKKVARTMQSSLWLIRHPMPMRTGPPRKPKPQPERLPQRL